MERVLLVGLCDTGNMQSRVMHYNGMLPRTLYACTNQHEAYAQFAASPERYVILEVQRVFQVIAQWQPRR